jgi:hypothetical protein
MLSWLGLSETFERVPNDSIDEIETLKATDRSFLTQKRRS